MHRSACGLSGGGGQRGVKAISVALGGTVCCCGGSGRGAGEGTGTWPAACVFYISTFPKDC